MVCNYTGNQKYNKNHLSMHVFIIVLAVAQDYVLCLQTGPLITKYIETFYPPDNKPPCLTKIFRFNTSGNPNSTYELIWYTSKSRDRISTDCRIDRDWYFGQGLCFVPSWEKWLMPGTKYRFGIEETTMDGKKLVSRDFFATIDGKKTRNKDLRYLHAVTINGNASKLVHLTWIEFIPPEICGSESLIYGIMRTYHLQRMTVHQGNVKDNDELEFKNKDVSARRIDNIQGYKYWSRCHKIVTFHRKPFQQKYKMFYSINVKDKYFSNNATLTDLSELLPKPRCFMNGSEAILQWQAAVNDSNSIEVLTVPYTHYKLTVGNDTRKILPLNTSQYKTTINGNTVFGGCPDMLFYLNICLWEACTNRPIGCNPCRGSDGVGSDANSVKPNVKPSSGGNQKTVKVSNWWFLSLLILLPIAKLIMFLRHRKQESSTTSTATTTANVNPVNFVDERIIVPRPPPYSLPPPRSDKGPALPPLTITDHVYYHLTDKKHEQETNT